MHANVQSRPGSGWLSTVAARAPGLPLVFALLATPTLVIPWFVEVRPARSVSFIQGFSNPAFWGLLVALFIVPSYFLFRRARVNEATAPNAMDCLEESQALQRWAWIMFIACATFLLVFGSNLAGVLEAEYFLVRMDLTAQGWVPYRDFEYAYGPLLLYVPLLLTKVGLSPSRSIGLLVVAQTTIGFVAIHSIIARLFMPSAARWLLACMVLATASSMLMGGQNYTFVRFAGTAAIACAILPHARAAWIRASAATGPLFVLAWSLSPEVALAIAVAYGGMCCMLSERRWSSALLAAVSVLACGSAVPLLKDSYRTLFEFAGGGNNFPVYPSLHVLFIMACVLLSTAHVARRPLREHPIDWFLFLYSVAMIPGGFGRGDALHAVFYEFGFVLLAARYCMDNVSTSAAFRRFCAIYLAIFLAGALALHANHTAYKLVVMILRTTFAAASALEGRGAVMPARMHAIGEMFGKADTHETGVEGDPGHVFVIAPRSDMPLADRRLATYFIAFENATSVAAYRMLGEQIRGKRVLIRPKVLDVICGREKTEQPSVLFLFPTNIFRERNDVRAVTAPFCDRLYAAQRVADRSAGFVELPIP